MARILFHLDPGSDKPGIARDYWGRSYQQWKEVDFTPCKGMRVEICPYSCIDGTIESVLYKMRDGYLDVMIVPDNLDSVPRIKFPEDWEAQW